MDSGKDFERVLTPTALVSICPELPAADAANVGGEPLAGTHTFEFLIMRGDVNGSGTVNFADYGGVGSNFDPLPGANYRAGDANGDGQVNFADYGVIGANFNPLGLASLAYDLGDAPQASTNYPTTIVNEGAIHVIGSGPFLGTSIDSESDGQPHANAQGDDNVGDDEDGVSFGSLTAGLSANITVVAAVPTSAVLNAWVDFNADGDWNDSGEQIFTSELLVNGSNALSFSIPAAAASGDTFARFRVTTTADYSFTGMAPDGEVEDYKITIAVGNASPAGLVEDLSAKSAADDVTTSVLDEIVTNETPYSILVSDAGVTDNRFPWQNPANPADVNDDGTVSILDALIGINLLNDISSPLLNTNQKLPTSRPASSTLAYYDVNEDGYLSPLDVLIVVNYLNRPLRAEGELTFNTSPSTCLTGDTRKSTIVAPPRTSKTTLAQPAASGNNDDFFRIVGEAKRSIRAHTQLPKESDFIELLDTLAAYIARSWRQ